MVTNGVPPLGRFSVDVELANNDDLALARAGQLPADKVRRAKIHGVVDSGATHMVLPASVVKQLGIRTKRKVKVHYADRRYGMRDVVEGVFVEIQGRDGIFNAVVEPKRESALIGAIILEVMDFLVDAKHQRLVPRDPRYVVAELE